MLKRGYLFWLHEFWAIILWFIMQCILIGPLIFLLYGCWHFHSVSQTWACVHKSRAVRRLAIPGPCCWRVLLRPPPQSLSVSTFWEPFLWDKRVGPGLWENPGWIRLREVITLDKLNNSWLKQLALVLVQGGPLDHLDNSIWSQCLI